MFYLNLLVINATLINNKYGYENITLNPEFKKIKLLKFI